MSAPTQELPEELALLGLMQLTDSALPTGAFSHSFGFETAMARGQLETEAEFSAWLEMFVDQQLAPTDAVAIRLVMAAEQFAEVADLDELVTAQALPQQVREGGRTMGRRLLEIGRENYPSPWLEQYRDGVRAGSLHGHQATVWGVLARGLGISPDTAVSAHLYASAVSLTQNAVRGIPLGQNAGQRIIRAAQPWVRRGVESSRGVPAEELGAVPPGLEIAQMNHERQRARLFMS